MSASSGPRDEGGTEAFAPARVTEGPPVPADADRTRPGDDAPAHRLGRIGDYRLVREVGRGGMGVVYEAEQLSLGRRVALKVLPAQVATDRKALERFRREAKAAARLHHTNIVPVFEVGRDGPVAFYAMQFIRGRGLDAVVAELARLRAAPRTAPAPGPGSTGEATAARHAAGPSPPTFDQVAADPARAAGPPPSPGPTRPPASTPARPRPPPRRWTGRRCSAPRRPRAAGARAVAPGGPAGRHPVLRGRPRRPPALLPGRGPGRPPGGRGAWPTPTPGASSTATSSPRTC